MASPHLEHSLLEGNESPSQKGNYRRVLVTSGVFVLLAGSLGFYGGTLYAAHGDFAAKLSPTSMNYTELALASYAPDCYSFTGGTCLKDNCNAARKATCSDGKCICANGCTGADGNCVSKHYPGIATGVTFTNKYWSSHWLYVQGVSLLGQMAVSSAPKATFGGSQDFDVYELPGLVNGKKQYFLASSKWHKYVAAVRSTGSVLSLSASLWGLYSVDLQHSTVPYDPQGITVHICKVMRGGKEDPQKAVMIGSSGAWNRPIWAYIHRGSDFVYGWMLTSDPGSGGYWVPSQPLPGLQEC